MDKPAAKSVAIIGVPLDWGAGRRGTALGPGMIRSAGVAEKLTALGWRVKDEGDLRVPATLMTLNKPSPANLKNLQKIVAVNRRLCRKVAKVAGLGSIPLVLGGDHSVAIGTVSGVRLCYRELGLIWFDAHGDANTPDTTPSGNIHGMPLSALLGFGDSRLSTLGGRGAKVKPEHTVIVGARSLDPGERDFLKKAGVTVYTMRDLDRLGMAEVMSRAILQAADGTNGIHLSFDLDALDPMFAPGVGTPVAGGVSLRESCLAMEMLADSGVLVSAEFVEVNPLLDIENKTAETAAMLIGYLFGDKIL